MIGIVDLIYIRLNIACFPALCMAALTLGNVNERGRVNPMLPTKLHDTCNGVLCTIRRSNKHGSHALCNCHTEGFAVSSTPFWISSLFLRGFTFFLSCCFAILSTSTSSANPCKSFRSVLPGRTFSHFTTPFSAHDLACLGSMFIAQIRTSNTGSIKASPSKRLESIKAALLTGRQEVRDKHDLDNLKDKGIRAVLIPCALQGNAVMLIVAKSIKVLIASLAKIDSRTDVKAAISGTGDAIDTGRCGDITSIHFLNHHFRLVTLFLLVARMVRCPISSHGAITPMLGNALSIAFFQWACKAEVQGSALASMEVYS